MDKKSIIGFVLMAAVLFGYTFFQSKKAKEQYEIKARQDSIALAAAIADTIEVVEAAAADTKAAPVAQAKRSIYKDASLNAAAKAEGELITLSNSVFEFTVNTRGAQPWAVKINDFTMYGGDDLYLLKAGQNSYNISVEAGQYLSTKDFTFSVAEHTDSTLVLQLPFDEGGYIQQSYKIFPDKYDVKSEIALVGLNLKRNLNSMDIDFLTVIPRLEKGYKNESQYSKLNYYFDGEKKPVEMGRGRSSAKNLTTRFDWFAFQQQFFSMIVCAPQKFSSGKVAIDYMGDADPDRNLMTCRANVSVDIQPGNEVVVPLDYYFGPNRFNTLKTYNRKYEKIVPLGGWLVGWFTRYVIIPLFNWLHNGLGIANFGIIILIMTLIIKTAVFPLTYKSYASSAKMSALKPYVEEINAKYPKQEDAMKKQQATMDLYKRADASPLGGCLPTLLTFPILWAMFRFFPASIELRQQRFLWAEDLSAYDSIVDFGTRIPLIGDHLSLFALLMAIVMWAYSKMTMSQQAAGNDPTASSMKFMNTWLMPIMMFFICNNLSAGLSYYYLLSQLVAMIQIFVIRKWIVKPEKVIAKVEASKGKPLPKSKWQQRIEEAQKMQQQQLKQQGRRR